MTADYGEAIVKRHDDGTLTVEHADDRIAVAFEVLAQMGMDRFDVGTGLLVLDTAAQYCYRPVSFGAFGRVVICERVRQSETRGAEEQVAAGTAYMQRYYGWMQGQGWPGRETHGYSEGGIVRDTGEPQRPLGVTSLADRGPLHVQNELSHAMRAYTDRSEQGTPEQRIADAQYEIIQRQLRERDQ